MLERLEPLGSLKVPNGILEFGLIGSTSCVFLRFVGGPGDPPYLIYTPEELGSLVAILRYAEKLSQTTQPGQILRVGVMRAKPIVMRIALIHPNAGDPFLLLRWLSGRGKLDLSLPLAAAIELFSQGQQADPTPTVCGMVRRAPDGCWLVAGRSFHVVPGHSPGHGYYGEYLHPDEVRDGEEVVLWSFSSAGCDWIGAFRTLQQWQPPGQVDEPMAQEGDVALFHGEIYRCRQIHKTFAQTLLPSVQLSPVWAAKLALSSLLCDIADGEDEAGHATWVGNSPDPILQSGIAALEQGQASAHDLALYQQLSCYFHALGADQDSAAHSVNTILEGLFTQLSEVDPSQRRRLLSNWALHLKDIFDGKPPREVSEPWKKAKERYPGRVLPKVLCFPPPSPWVLESASAPPPPPPSTALSDLAEPMAAESTGVEKPSAPRVPEPQASEPQVSELQASESSAPEPPLASAHRAGSPPSRRGLGMAAAGVGVALLAVVGWKLGSGGSEVATSPTPVAATATASALPTGLASASPSPSPRVADAPSPAATAQPIVATIDDPSRLRIGGLDPEGKFYVDRDVDGMTMLESGPGWARYDKEGHQVFLGALLTGTRKSTRATAFASEALFLNEQPVLTAGITKEQIPANVLEALESRRIRVVLDEATATVLGFTTGEFPETTVGLGQPLGAALYKAFEERDLQAFQQGLTPETANLTFMDGEALFSKVAQKANVEAYCRALIAAGADVQGRVGAQALWATADPKIAKMLVDAGLAVDEPGPQGRTKLFGAEPEMTKVLLAAGANPNAQDEAGATPLFATQQAEVSQLLVKAGADPNHADQAGRTPLMGASAAKTQALLALGADPSRQDREGRTALDYAGADYAVVEALRSAPAVRPVKPTSSPTPAATP